LLYYSIKKGRENEKKAEPSLIEKEGKGGGKAGTSLAISLRAAHKKRGKGKEGGRGGAWGPRLRSEGRNGKIILVNIAFPKRRYRRA